MEEKRKYIRQIVAFANYFKDFKKTLPRNALSKISDFCLYHDAGASTGEISENTKDASGRDRTSQADHE
ncbi:hypothetical protein [Parabacteroides johnsonii]|uniref:hypothetical protein n=1 Tax=Parabacteroides johnsonii TaxID=387661 RepID=UPI0016522ECD|nr:hypothetical protein [Parabacteroides johnsonii]